MSDYKRRYQNTEYVYGSAVRKLNTAPEYDRDYDERVRERNRREEEIREVQRSNQKKHKRVAKRRGMDFVSFLFLVVSIGITLFVCVDFLKVQSEIVSMSKEVATLESANIVLKQDNIAMKESIYKAIDMEKIFDVATKELGMVYANKNQVVKYNATKSDYVRQYGEIPTVNKTDILDEISKFIK